MKLRLLAFLLFAAATASAEERYVVSDAGLFASTGRPIEFADRFGWRGYEAKFDLRLDPATRRMSSASSLAIVIHRAGGGVWSHTCKARDPREMFANVNSLYGQGVLAVVQCRIKPERFAEAVGLDPDMVGEPTLVFSAWIREGKAEAGIQKGLYFLDGGQMRSSVMAQYASEDDDPSELSVVFATTDMPAGVKPWQSGAYRYQTQHFLIRK